MGLCALMVVGPSAVVAAPQVFTCDVVPVSPQKGQYALNYRLTVEEDGSARIEGLRSKDVRVRQNNGKTRTDWNWSPFRFSSVTTDATGATKVNAKAHGYVGSLRWQGTCK